MSQIARSMMPTPSMSTLYRAVAMMTLAGTTLSASASGPEQAAKPFFDNSGTVTTRTVALPKNPTPYNDQDVLSGRMILHVHQYKAFQSEFETVLAEYPSLSVLRPLDADKGVYLLDAGSVGDAIRSSQLLMKLPSVIYVQLEQADNSLMSQLARGTMPADLQRRLLARPMTHRSANDFPGVRPLPEASTGPRGSLTDPLFGSIWHFQNTLDPDPNLNPDNNITADIYNTMGYSGAGVTIGLSNQGINTHIDTDHTELDMSFDPNLTMDFDPVLFPDNLQMTAIAGLMTAEVDGASIQGVAPSSTLGTFTWPTAVGSIPFQEFQGYDWKFRDIDIKVYDTGNGWYNVAANGYNAGALNDFVNTPLKNSFAFGRNRRGTINVFGTGMNVLAQFDVLFGGLPKYPDPFNFPPAAASDSWSPLDEVLNSGNEVSVTLTNGYTAGPYYPNGQIGFYGPANDRRSFVFATVAEGDAGDNPEEIYADIYAAQGPAVFASFYGGTTNQFQSGSQATSGRGVLTTVPGAGNVALFPASTDAIPTSDETLTGAAVGAGVIALMIEANPRLTIRDIQHILFESIQESPKDPRIKWPNFDVNRSYVSKASAIPGLSSFWQVNSGLYTGGSVTNQAIRHSDLYGFGVVDAELAVTKAATWEGTDRLILLDTGLVGSFSDDGIDTDAEIEVEIPDATFFVGLEADGETGTNGAATSIIALAGASLPDICVRQNIKIESIIVEVTVEGDGNQDLFITLTSPNATRSVLKMPHTGNLLGTSDSDVFTDDDGDTAGEVVIGGTNYALYRQSFLTWKHWGELSAGDWSINFTDFGPDEALPEGEEPTTGMDPTPGADMVTTLGPFGVTGSEFRSEKTVTGYRFRIYGTDIGEPVFEGCNPFETSCPADLNGDGIVDVQDLQVFIQYFQDGNAIADLNGDGSVDYLDLLIYRGIWQPGYCNGTGLGGGRPRPGDTNAGDDNNPSSRPI